MGALPTVNSVVAQDQLTLSLRTPLVPGWGSSPSDRATCTIGDSGTDRYCLSYDFSAPKSALAEADRTFRSRIDPVFRRFPNRSCIEVHPSTKFSVFSAQSASHVCRKGSAVRGFASRQQGLASTWFGANRCNPRYDECCCTENYRDPQHTDASRPNAARAHQSSCRLCRVLTFCHKFNGRIRCRNRVLAF